MTERDERDLQDEIELHLELRARELEACGMSPREARRAALEAFGDVRRVEAACREAARAARGRKGRRDLMESVRQDLRFAARTLRRSPGFAAAAVITLGLGIGATTAIFALADAALLRAPPVREPERLAMVYTTCRAGQPRCASSYPDFLDYRARSTRFQDLAAYSWVPLSLGRDEAAAHLVTGLVVSGSYFPLLGVSPAAGRLLQPGDDVRGGGAAVAVLAHRLWSERFGEDGGVVGRTVHLNGTPFTVVGVAPRGFEGIDLGGGPEVWVPMAAGPLLGPAAGWVGDPSALDARGDRWIAALVGRLAPGATVEQARQEMLAVSEGLRREDPEARGPRSVTVDPAPRYVLPVAAEDTLTRFLGLLVGVVVLTLLLACANLANLLLARASLREREVGMRLALGAGRGRLVRQLLTESLALAFLGGALGLVVGRILLEVLGSFRLPGDVPVASLGAGLDGRVLAFALAASAATGVLFGLVPALRASRPDLMPALRGGTRRGRGGGHRLRRGLVAVQLALSMVLLAGSGLFLRTLGSALAFDPGFRPEGAAIVRYNLTLLRYGEAEALDFVRRITERAASLPGVEVASHATVVPFQGGVFRGTFVEVEGYEAAPDEEMRVNYAFVQPGYFRALGTPVREGRELDARDAAGSAPVIVVSEAAARRWWPGRSAVGGRVRLAGRELEVVGVAADARWRSLDEAPEPYVFGALEQFPSQAASGFVTLVVRTSGRASEILPALRAEFRAADPRLALTRVASLEELVRDVLMPQRLGALLLTALALLAVALSAVGVYGVVAFAVASQRRDIGIRMALGAERRRVLGLVLGGMVRPVALGLLAGLAAARILSRTIEGFLFGVRPDDLATYAVLAVGLAGVALAATLIPARAAARVDPIEVLGGE